MKPTHFKSVQTVFSTIDLVTGKTTLNSKATIKRSKSTEDFKARSSTRRDEIIEWIREVYKTNKTILWGEKLQKLAEKLQKPGGEEKIRMKILKFLQRMPSQFSDGDEEGRDFREKLPDMIIRRLKKIYVNPNSESQSPIEVYRVDDLKYQQRVMIQRQLRSIVKNWFKSVSIRKRDFLNQKFKKDDAFKFLVYRLEPFLLHRPNCNSYFRNMLQTFLLEIINEMPIQVNGDKTFILKITDELIDELLKVNDQCKDKSFALVRHKITNLKRAYVCHYCSVKRNSTPTTKEIEDFVAVHIKHVIDKISAGNICSNKRISFIEIEIKDLLMQAIESKVTDDDLKRCIKVIIQEVCKLPDNKAKHCAKTIIKDFNKVFDLKNKDERRKLKSKARSLGNAYSETHIVFNSASENRIKSLNYADYTKRETSQGNINISFRLYAKQIEDQINHWLTSLHLKIPAKHQLLFRQIAISDLATDIINRKTYMEFNPSCRCSDKDEIQNLKFQIYKCLGKLVVQDTLTTINCAPQLMKRIQCIPVPKQDGNLRHKDVHKTFQCCNQKMQDVSIQSDSSEKIDNPYVNQLYEDIFGCFNGGLEYSNDERFKRQLVRDLAKGIDKDLKEKIDPEDIIEQELELWTKKLLNGKPINNMTAQLKERVKHINFRHQAMLKNIKKLTNKNDASFQVAASTKDIANDTENIVSQKSEDVSTNSLDLYLQQIVIQIDEWLKSLQIPPISGNRFKDVAVRDLAGDIVERHTYLEMNPLSRGTKEDELENLKYQIFKWINKIVGEDNVETIQNAAKLMERIHSIPSPKLNQDSQNLNSCPISPPGHTNVICRKKSDTISVFSLRDCNIQELQDTRSPLQIQSNSKTGVTGGVHVNQIPIFSKPFQGESMTINHNSKSATKSYSSVRVNATDQKVDLTGSCLRRVRNYEPAELEGKISQTITEVYQMPRLQSRGPGGSIREENQANQDKTMNNVGILGIPNIPQKEYNEKESENKQPQKMTVNEIYEYFDNILKERCAEIPITTNTPEQKTLEELARKSIYNGIWRTYFRLKADPNIEKDYVLFEAKFEDQLNIILNCLPQTQEAISYQQVWKAKIVLDAINMLKYIHSITDSPTYRQELVDRCNRQFIRTRIKEFSNQRHVFVERAADAYLLYTRYKNDYPVKANIYRQRLMKKLEELVEYAKTVLNVDCRFIPQEQLCQEAFKILASVPIPNNETLNNEAEQILICDEIEQWYNELPVKPLHNVTDDIMRNRMRELLAKKLHKIETQLVADDPSLEREIKHEVSMFLKRDAELEEGETININYMVEQLASRLKSRRLQTFPGYKTFERGKPNCSSLNQSNPGVLAPLIEVQTRRNSNNKGVLGTKQVAGSSNQYNLAVPHNRNAINPAPLNYVFRQDPYACGATATGSTARVRQRTIDKQGQRCEAVDEREINTDPGETDEDESEYYDDDRHSCSCLARLYRYRCRRVVYGGIKYPPCVYAVPVVCPFM